MFCQLLSTLDYSKLNIRNIKYFLKFISLKAQSSSALGPYFLIKDDIRAQRTAQVPIPESLRNREIRVIFTYRFGPDRFKNILTARNGPLYGRDLRIMGHIRGLYVEIGVILYSLTMPFMYATILLSQNI